MAIEIVDLPIKNDGSFHSYGTVYQGGYPVHIEKDVEKGGNPWENQKIGEFPTSISWFLGLFSMRGMGVLPQKPYTVCIYIYNHYPLGAPDPPRGVKNVAYIITFLYPP